MKFSSSEKAIFLFLILALFFLGGCYTVLMDPSMLTSSGDERSVSTGGDYTSDTTLTYRYYDTQNTGFVTSPEPSIDPYGWQFPAASPPWWYEVLAPIPPTAIAVSSSSAAGSGQRRRTTGSTRGNDQPSLDINTSTTVTTTTTTITAPPPPAATAAPASGRTTGNNSAASAPATRKTGSNRGDGRD